MRIGNIWIHLSTLWQKWYLSTLWHDQRWCTLWQNAAFDTLWQHFDIKCTVTNKLNSKREITSIKFTADVYISTICWQQSYNQLVSTYITYWTLLHRRHLFLSLSKSKSTKTNPEFGWIKLLLHNYTSTWLSCTCNQLML